jgi:tetratricopeptide (TPR) repeat protein
MSVSAPARADAPPAAEVADQVSAAERFAAQAFEAYGKKQYSEAVALYEQAYASVPSADALYNIARVYDIGLQDRVRAIAAYERCLSEPGASLERLARASERLLVLRGAESANLESKHTPVQAGAAAQAPAPGEPDPHPGLSSLRVAALISGATGVVSLGVGLGFGVAVLADADQANAACEGNLCTSEGVAAAQSASTKATLATTGVCVGAALLVTSATRWLLGAEGDSEGGAQPGVRFTPVASANEFGVGLGGNW